MAQQDRTIFREHALEHYLQQQENDVLPQFVSPPIFLFFWLLVGLILVAGLLAWSQQVPVYVSGSGVALSDPYWINDRQQGQDVLLFIPADEHARFRPGMKSVVQLNSGGDTVNARVTSIDDHVYSPEAAQHRYDLSCNVAQNLSGPTMAVHMRVLVPAHSSLEHGSSLQAQVQVGMQRVLSLFPLFDSFKGDS